MKNLIKKNPKYLITFRDKNSMNFLAETIVEVKNADHKSNILMLSAIEKLRAEADGKELPRLKNSVWSYRITD